MDENIKRGNIMDKTDIIRICHCFHTKTYVFQIALVNQISMEPTLYEGEILVIAKVNYLFNDPERGDIVVLKDELEDKF